MGRCDHGFASPAQDRDSKLALSGKPFRGGGEGPSWSMAAFRRVGCPSIERWVLIHSMLAVFHAGVKDGLVPLSVAICGSDRMRSVPE